MQPMTANRLKRAIP